VCTYSVQVLELWPGVSNLSAEEMTPGAGDARFLSVSVVYHHTQLQSIVINILSTLF
jgi:hypothetical protein